MTTSIKEELAKELLNAIQATKEGIAKGADIAFQELPEIVNEILTFNLFKSGFWILFLAIFSCIIIWISKKIWSKIDEIAKINEEKKGYNDYYENMRAEKGLSYASLGGLLLISSVYAAAKLLEIGNILLAPRLYIIEYLSAFLK